LIDGAPGRRDRWRPSRPRSGSNDLEINLENRGFLDYYLAGESEEFHRQHPLQLQFSEEKPMAKELIVMSVTTTPTLPGQALTCSIRFELQRARNFIEKSRSENIQSP
jgi:hypothetical protein